MSIQLSVAVRNAELDSIQTVVGTSPLLEFITGAKPANCAASEAGTVLATLTLPVTWMAAASGGSKALSGTWSTTAGAAGTVGHFRLYDSTGSVCHMQGTVTITGGGGDMTLDNPILAVGQNVIVTAFTLPAGNS
jgi:hypothetical protein